MGGRPSWRVEKEGGGFFNNMASPGPSSPSPCVFAFAQNILPKCVHLLHRHRVHPKPTPAGHSQTDGAERPGVGTGQAEGWRGMGPSSCQLLADQLQIRKLKKIKNGREIREFVYTKSSKNGSTDIQNGHKTWC